MMFLDKVRFYIYVGLVIIHTLLSGCRSNATPTDQVYVSPKFSVVLEVNTDQEVHGSLIVSNSGDTPFPATDDFNAEMNLWTSGGELRARIDANMIQSIAPNEEVYLASGYWKLDPGVYFLTWGAPESSGNITVFTVIEDSGRVHLGETVRFQIKSLEFQAQAASAGSIQSFSLNEDGTAIISGETPVPDNNCVFPILFGDMGVVEGFPVGTCAQVADGQWQMSLPADPGGNGVELDIDTSYQVILFCEDLTLPPSQPFAIHISPPPRN